MSLSARGIGDIGAYLAGVHGVRPPHLGKKDIRTYFIPPTIDTRLATMPATAKGLVLWLIDGQVLSNQELAYLAQFPTLEPRVKIVIELGGDRQFRWVKLSDIASS